MIDRPQVGMILSDCECYYIVLSVDDELFIKAYVVYRQKSSFSAQYNGIKRWRWLVCKNDCLVVSP
jgi:peroxiredoxin